MRGGRRPLIAQVAAFGLGQRAPQGVFFGQPRIFEPPLHGEQAIHPPRVPPLLGKLTRQRHQEAESILDVRPATGRAAAQAAAPEGAADVTATV